MRTRLPLLAALVMAGVIGAFALVSVASATTFDEDGVYAPLSTEVLNQDTPIPNTGETPICTGIPPEIDADFDLEAGEVLWHFILSSPSASSGLLRADFANAGLTVPDVQDFDTPAQALHWYIITPGADSLLNASTNVAGGNLNLSHVCYQRQAHPEIATDASGDGSTGDELNDTAHLTGGNNPTGKITFTLYGPDDDDCSTAIYSEDVTVNGNGDYTTDGDGLPAGGNIAQTAGTYQWIAFYDSDTDSNADAGPTACNDPREASVVEASAPTVVTELHYDPDHGVITIGSEIPLGSSVHDSATVSGPAALGVPTGNVDFTFYRGGNCATGTPEGAGTDVPLVNGVADPSEAKASLAPGSYAFSAHYDSDKPGVWTNGDSTCEPFSVGKGQLNSATILHAPDHTVIANGDVLDLGSKVHDTAQISGQVAPFVPQNAVTFAFYGDKTKCEDGVAGGTPVDNIGADENSGDPRTADTDALAPGSYAFQASIAGDDNYEGSTSACEPFSVKKGQLNSATILHAPDHTVINNGDVLDLGSKAHDTAQISGQVVGFVPQNAVTFAFYGNKTKCEDGVAGGTPVDNIGADENSGDPRTADTDALAPGSYAFQASIAGDDNYEGSTSACEPFSVKQGELTAATKLHAPNHNVIANGTELALGSKLHDTAQIGGQVDGFVPANAATFTFFTNGDCTPGEGASDAANIGADENSGDPRTADTDALGAGSYSFQASIAGDDNYKGATSACEPFSVKKAQLEIVTAIHNAGHADITNTNVPVGTVVHDTATVTGAVDGFPIGAISFTLNGNPVVNADPAEAGFSASTVDSAPLVAGSYIYKADVAGNDNYFADTSPDEPLTVRTLGKTMGFWGNNNGQAALPANPNVTLGTVSATTCSIVVSTKAISKVILPNTLNGVSILTNCTTSASRDSGINANSLNTLLAQTLAISFNILYINGYTGQTIGGLGCTAVSPLTAASTVQQARDYANSLIANAKSGAPVVTQAQIGAMNTLLGCLNREA